MLATPQHIRKRRGVIISITCITVLVLLAHLGLNTAAVSEWRRDHLWTGSVLPDAINLLETKFYKHHPIMQLVPQETLHFDPNFLVEINNLRIPSHFDCENLPESNASWGGVSYFRSSPARWHACWLHFASLKSGLPGFVPPLPLIDEEYFEHIAIYDSVARAKSQYNIVELGARWGTWGARAVAFLRKVNPIPYDVLFVEALDDHCSGLKEVMEKNDIHYNLSCALAKPSDFIEWAANRTHVNLMDIDIQGAEKDFLANRKVMKIVEDKVHRLIIGTNSRDIHNNLREQFAHWNLLHDMPINMDLNCIKKYLHTPPEPDRSNFDSLVRLNCYYQSGSFGKIPNFDGELILDNPKFPSDVSLFTKAEYTIF